MVAQPIYQPGEALESVSLNDLLGSDEDSPVTAEWRRTMHEIEKSQHAAACEHLT